MAGALLANGCFQKISKLGDWYEEIKKHETYVQLVLSVKICILIIINDDCISWWDHLGLTNMLSVFY